MGHLGRKHDPAGRLLENSYAGGVTAWIKFEPVVGNVAADPIRQDDREWIPLEDRGLPSPEQRSSSRFMARVERLLGAVQNEYHDMFLCAPYGALALRR